MKLKQLLKAHFDTNGPTKMTMNGRFNGVVDWILNPNILNVYLEELNLCSEFAGSQVIILDDVKSGKPQRVLTGHDEDGIPIYEMRLSTVSLENEQIITTKLNERTKFAPLVKIYSISLGPEMFDPSDIFQTKVNTALLTPTMYDSDLSPSKRMVITFSPELAQDAAIKELRQELKEKDKIEDRPEFTVTTDGETTKEQKDAILKEQEINAQNLMEHIDQNELQKKQQVKEDEYLQTILGLVQECFKNPNQHLFPSKRPILIRLTKDSLVENIKPILNPADTVVILKS